MRTKGFWLVLLLLNFAGCTSKTTIFQQQESVSTIIAFENVRVLPMSDGSILERHTVLVDGERIAALAPAASTTLPVGAQIIDGSGLTLMPGLVDMHVHYWLDEEGVMFIANGVTSVRNMWGTAEQIRLDIRAKNGNLIGPHVFTTGPLMDGPDSSFGPGALSVDSPQAAVGAVEAQRATGYKMIKLLEELDPETYRAAVSAAKDRGMMIATHTPDSMTVEELLELKVDSIEHLDGYETALSGIKSNSLAETLDAWAGADESKMQDLAEKVAAAGVWSTATLTIYTQLPKRNDAADEFLGRPEVRFIPPMWLDFWRSRQSAFPPDMFAAASAGASARAKFVKALYDAGAKLIIGTDTANPFIVEGFSFHDELDNLSQAGIPNDALLRMATIEAAIFLGEEDEFGVVKSGARADLILVNGDPLTDLSVLREPVGVMMNGRWSTRDELIAILEANADRFENGIQ